MIRDEIIAALNLEISQLEQARDMLAGTPTAEAPKRQGRPTGPKPNIDVRSRKVASPGELVVAEQHLGAGRFEGRSVNGHTRDLQIAEDGTLNEIEEEVAMDALPASVKTALMAKANGAQIVKVESLTKQGKLVAYEAATLKHGHKGELQVGPDGGKLAHEG